MFGAAGVGVGEGEDGELRGRGGAWGWGLGWGVVSIYGEENGCLGSGSLACAWWRWFVWARKCCCSIEQGFCPYFMTAAVLGGLGEEDLHHLWRWGADFDGCR